MITTYRKERSLAGHPIDVLKSGLQKYIRRGLFEKAIYCAIQLDLFQSAPEGKRIHTNFRHRLYVILLEDVGNPAIIPECYDLIKRGQPSDIYRAIELMCASPKERICSHARAVYSPRMWQYLEAFPELADEFKSINPKFDVGRVEREFVKQYRVKRPACLYYAFVRHYDSELLLNSYKRRRKSAWFVFKTLAAAGHTVEPCYEDMLVELGTTRENFLPWCIPLLMHLGILQPIAVECPDLSHLAPDLWQQHLEGKASEFIPDDYILDKHTRSGATGKKTYQNFVNEGARVSPEVSRRPLWKRVYEIMADKPAIPEKGTISGEFTRESEYAAFMVRTQLPTATWKQDVYLARRDDKVIVIKGPYADDKGPKVAIKVAAWKRAQRLPYIPVEMVYLIPDRWDERTPLGLRNSLSRQKPAPFLVSEYIYDQAETMEHSSKLWPPTEVLVPRPPLDFLQREGKESEGQMTDYVLALLSRYVWGISDLADRNFLQHQGRVYGIDEDVEGKDVGFIRELRGRRCALIAGWLSEHYDGAILPAVSRWSIDPARKVYLSRVQNRADCIQLFTN